MPKFLDLSTTAKRFRFIAVIEAFTWAGLLIAMYFKYFTGNPYTNAGGQKIYPNDQGVQVLGMIHGIAFILFLIGAFLAARAFKWSAATIVAALVGSILPFCSVIFEAWAVRNGKLGELSRADAVATGAGPAYGES